MVMKVLQEMATKYCTRCFLMGYQTTSKFLELDFPPKNPLPAKLLSSDSTLDSNLYVNPASNYQEKSV